MIQEASGRNLDTMILFIVFLEYLSLDTAPNSIQIFLHPYFGSIPVTQFLFPAGRKVNVIAGEGTDKYLFAIGYHGFVVASLLNEGLEAIFDPTGLRVGSQ